MGAWFRWKGVRSDTYGIHVLTQASIVMPAERVEKQTIPGRPGSLIYTEGEGIYEDFLLTLSCYIEDSSRLNEICTWLMGSGNLEISNRAGGHYEARVNNQISFGKLLRVNPHLSFNIVFRCHPYWYYDGTADITVTTSGTTITNPGGMWSEPILTISGSGEAELMVGTTLILLSDIPQTLVIDSVVKEAYQGNVLKNELMNGEFPTLYPGANAISWTGNITSVVVRPNWRAL